MLLVMPLSDRSKFDHTFSFGTGNKNGLLVPNTTTDQGKNSECFRKLDTLSR